MTDRLKLLFLTISFVVTSACTTTNSIRYTVDDWSAQKKLVQTYKETVDRLNQSQVNESSASNQIHREKKLSDCAQLQNLTLLPQFILKDYTLLQYKIYCTQTQAENSLINRDLFQNKPWLTELLAEALWQEALRNKDPEKMTTALVEKAKASNQIKQKTDFLKAALQFARQTKKTTLIKDTEERLWKASPRFLKNPKPQDWYRIAQDYLYNRDFNKSRQYLTKIVNGKEFTTEDKYQARRLLRNSFKIEQQKEKHLTAALKLSQWLQKNDPYSQRHYDSLITYARALWTENQIQQSQKILHKLTLQFKNKISLDEVYWLFGRMAEEARNYQKAIDYYSVAERENRQNSGLKEKILFQKAWCLMKIQKYEDSARVFSELQKNSSDSFAVIKYQFWEATNWKKAKQDEAATALYKKVQKDDPLGYYGLLSYFLLSETMPPLQFLHAESLTNPSRDIQLSTEHQFMIASFAITEDKKSLEKYFNHFIGQSELQKIDDEKTTLFVLGNLAEAGLYQPLLQITNKMPTETRNRILLSHPELLFPQKYTELIKKWSQHFQIDGEYPLAIIRQESSFDPLARSPADAFGLMQLLPEIAKRYQPATGIIIDHHEELYLPEKNIPVGTALLAHLLEKYKGQYILSTAAYNASEKAIATWLHTRFDGDPIEFIEDIPYEETRTYVKLVMRNFIYYRRLFNPLQETEFPTRWLQINRM